MIDVQNTMNEAEIEEWTAAMRAGGQRAYEIANGDQAPAYANAKQAQPAARREQRDPSSSATSRKAKNTSPSVVDPKAVAMAVAARNNLIDALVAMRR